MQSARDQESGAFGQTLGDLSEITRSFEDGAKTAVDTIHAGASEGGQAIGDEAVRKLLSQASVIGQQIGQAVGAAIAAQVAGIKVNVAPSSAPSQPSVTGNTGKTNAFVNRPINGGGA
jgi:hypothetical protein